MTLLLLATLALASDPPSDTPADAPEAAPVATTEDEATPQAEEAPQAEAPAPAVPEGDRLVWSAEPLGQGDDRVATVLEALVGELKDPLLACRDGHDDAGRILSTSVKLSLDGSVKKAKAVLSTGDKAVDTCALDQLRALVVDPAPMFADVLRVNLRWAPPKDPSED